MKTVDAFAIGAVTCCIIGTIECSKEVLQYPPLLASLVFFALSWALLLPFYYLQANPVSGEDQHELIEMLSAYSALLLMLTAVPLRSGLQGSAYSVDAINIWAMRSLYLIVVPHSFAFIPGVQRLLHARQIGITHLALSTVGLFLITRALWFLTGGHSAWIRALWWIMLIVTTVYGIAQIWHGSKVVRHSPSHTPMPDSYKWLFAALKIAFCSIFLAIVLLVAKSR